MFADKTEVVFISRGDSLREDYHKLVSELKGNYFTIITDAEEWTDENYMQNAIDMLKRIPEFSIYGANAYNVSLDEKEYDLLNIHYDGLYDGYYKEFINYGIDDFFYHLSLNRKTQMLVIPQEMVFTNNQGEYECLLGGLDDIVLETVSLKILVYFLNLKHGMSVLKNQVVAKIDLKKLPEWKRYIEHAIQVYVLKDIYPDRNPRWIYEYVNFEYYNGVKALREDMKRGSVVSDKDIEPLDYLENISESFPKGSPIQIKNYGEKNPDKIFLVLEFERRGLGVLAITFQMLGAIKYARENGLIPIIDFKNHFLRTLQTTDKRHKENAWEYYYEQPLQGITLDEVYESKNVMHCDEFAWCNPIWYDLLPTDSVVVNQWNQIIQSELRLKPEVSKYVEESYQKIMADKRGILGVSLRAAFVREQLGGGELVLDHPIQVKLYETINMIKEYMDMWNCEWVFLVVDDAFWFEEIRNAFDGKCLYVDRIRQHHFDKNNEITDGTKVAQEVFENGLVKNNIEYLCETYLLARCDSLLAGNCGCSRMAYFLNNNQYEHVEIIDKGKY